MALPPLILINALDDAGNVGEAKFGPGLSIGRNVKVSWRSKRSWRRKRGPPSTTGVTRKSGGVWFSRIARD